MFMNPTVKKIHVHAMYRKSMSIDSIVTEPAMSLNKIVKEYVLRNSVVNEMYVPEPNSK